MGVLDKVPPVAVAQPWFPPDVLPEIRYLKTKKSIDVIATDDKGNYFVAYYWFGKLPGWRIYAVHYLPKDIIRWQPIIDVDNYAAEENKAD
jgi:hypothetical protein